jgi:hypothetical protein
VGARAGLDAVVKRKIPSPCRDSNPLSSSPYSSPIPLSYADSFSSSYSTKIVYTSTFLISMLQATCPAYLSRPDFITLIISGEELKL